MKKREKAVKIIANIGYIIGSISLFAIGLWIAFMLFTPFSSIYSRER